MKIEEKKNFNKLLTCLYIIIGILLINTIILYTVVSDNKKETTTEETENTEYDVSMFEKITANQLVDLFDSDKTQVIYVGRATCGYCVAFLPVLQKAQNDFDYKTQYYDISSLTTEDKDKIVALDNSEKFLATNFGSTPMVLLVRDGKLIDGWVGNYEYSKFESFLTKNGF